MRPVTINPQNPVAALTELQRASHENDLAEIAQNFIIGNAPAAQRVLNGSSVQVGAANSPANTSENVLLTYSLPAGALSAVGEGLAIVAAGTVAANNNIKTLKLYFGSTVVITIGPNAFNNIGWVFRADISKIGSSQQLVAVGYDYGASRGSRVLFPTETDTAAIVIKVTAQSGTGTAADIVARMMTASAALTDVSDVFATFILDCQKGGQNRTT